MMTATSAENFRTILNFSGALTRTRTEGRFGRVQTFKHRDLAAAVADVPAGERVLITAAVRPRTADKHIAAMGALGFEVAETLWDVTEPIGSRGDLERRVRLVLVRRT